MATVFLLVKIGGLLWNFLAFPLILAHKPSDNIFWTRRVSDVVIGNLAIQAFRKQERSNQ